MDFINPLSQKIDLSLRTPGLQDNLRTGICGVISSKTKTCNN